MAQRFSEEECIRNWSHSPISTGYPRLHLLHEFGLSIHLLLQCLIPLSIRRLTHHTQHFNFAGRTHRLGEIQSHMSSDADSHIKEESTQGLFDPCRVDIYRKYTLSTESFLAMALFLPERLSLLLHCLHPVWCLNFDCDGSHVYVRCNAFETWGHDFQKMTNNRSQYLRRERNLCAMTFINTVVFFALVVGQHILPGTVFLFRNEPVIFFKLQLTCSLANASVNPIIYNIFGRQYRKAFIQTMVCRVSSLSSRNSNIV